MSEKNIYSDRPVCFSKQLAIKPKHQQTIFAWIKCNFKNWFSSRLHEKKAHVISLGRRKSLKPNDSLWNFRLEITHVWYTEAFGTVSRHFCTWGSCANFPKRTWHLTPTQEFDPCQTCTCQSPKPEFILFHHPNINQGPWNSGAVELTTFVFFGTWKFG